MIRTIAQGCKFHLITISPFKAILSAPTITELTLPSFNNAPAVLSQIITVSMPLFINSHDVSLLP